MSEEILGRDEYYELVVMTAEGQQLRRLAIDILGGDASSIHFAWSPDGSRLAFTSEHRLYVASANGRPRRLPVTGEIQGVAWSPNGRRLVWNTEYGALHVGELNGGHGRALVTRETVDQQLPRGRSEPAWIQAGAWAPGREIAFSMAFRCPSSFDVHVVNVATGVIRRVTGAAC